MLHLSLDERSDGTKESAMRFGFSLVGASIPLLPVLIDAVFLHIRRRGRPIARTGCKIVAVTPQELTEPTKEEHP